mmetsp:Transcript_49599/g.94764  ORF Transcript_49599/g.94764 Transcript_49599/m.94764 type:complete len:238 (-) Transcript_49599:314-1027(-)
MESTCHGIYVADLPFLLLALCCNLERHSLSNSLAIARRAARASLDDTEDGVVLPELAALLALMFFFSAEDAALALAVAGELRAESPDMSGVETLALFFAAEAAVGVVILDTDTRAGTVAETVREGFFGPVCALPEVLAALRDVRITTVDPVLCFALLAFCFSSFAFQSCSRTAVARFWDRSLRASRCLLARGDRDPPSLLPPPAWFRVSKPGMKTCSRFTDLGLWLALLSSRLYSSN